MHRRRGVSMIELLIALALLTILLALGAPALGGWMQSAQTRTAAESILNGLQSARNESVRRNAVVRFQLTDAGGLVEWTVGCVNPSEACPATLYRRPYTEGGVGARAGISTAPIPQPTPPDQFKTPLAAGSGLAAGVSFNGLGRVDNLGGDITRIDITHAKSAGARRYVVTIGGGGEIRLCDPALALADDPKGCS